MFVVVVAVVDVNVTLSHNTWNQLLLLLLLKWSGGHQLLWIPEARAVQECTEAADICRRRIGRDQTTRGTAALYFWYFVRSFYVQPKSSIIICHLWQLIWICLIILWLFLKGWYIGTQCNRWRWLYDYVRMIGWEMYGPPRIVIHVYGDVFCWFKKKWPVLGYLIDCTGKLWCDCGLEVFQYPG